MAKTIKLPKSHCRICKHSILTDGRGNVYCPKLLTIQSREASVGGYIMMPFYCRFYEKNVEVKK